MKAFLIKMAAIVSFLITAAFLSIYLASSIVYILLAVGFLTVIGAFAALFTKAGGGYTNTGYWNSIKEAAKANGVLSKRDKERLDKLIKEAEEISDEWFI